MSASIWILGSITLSYLSCVTGMIRLSNIECKRKQINLYLLFSGYGPHISIKHAPCVISAAWAFWKNCPHRYEKVICLILSWQLQLSLNHIHNYDPQTSAMLKINVPNICTALFPGSGLFAGIFWEDLLYNAHPVGAVMVMIIQWMKKTRSEVGWENQSLLLPMWKSDGAIRACSGV